MDLPLSVIFFAFLALLSQISAAAIDLHLYAKHMSGKHFLMSFQNGNECTYARTKDPAIGAGFEKGRLAKAVIDKAWIASNLTNIGSACHNETTKHIENGYPSADKIAYADTYSLVYSTVQAAS